jgi:hypothetical protein
VPELTLQEALQSDEVRNFLGGLIQESVEELLPAAVKSAIDEEMPALRESVREEIAQDGQLDVLHAEAKTLIESAKGLTPAARQNLLDDYGLAEEGDKVKPGRALALIECVKDGEGKVTKTAKAVLREAVEADVKRVRNVLRESAPTIPRAPGGGTDENALQEAPFLGDASPLAQRLKEKGLDPAQFGATPTPTPNT